MRNRKGFTLMEVLIAASIFAMVSIIGAVIFINISQSERKTELVNAIYEDARVIMETLAKEIRGGTIDYEEYYSINVLGADSYGLYRGAYGSRFYDPGYYFDGVPKKGTNPDNLGIECFNESGEIHACDEDHTIIYQLSVDKNMGQNPYDATTKLEQDKASAFCDESKNLPVPCPQPNDQGKLYLISKDGRTKTILLRRLIAGDDYALAMVKMDGTDTDNNGVIDTFTCQAEYKCPEDGAHPGTPTTLDTETPFAINTSQFMPISPLRSSVSALKFIIWPDEDPYKAFSELDVQYQPRVTIILTLKPSSEEMQNYPGEDVPEITIQTTVSTGAMQKISTYPPERNLDKVKCALDPALCP
jgi:prepilin-type N-terminal cleavage/methylation domain-containing protein